MDKRIITIVILVAMVTSLAVPFFWAPKEAQALVPVTVLTDIPKMVWDVVKKAAETVRDVAFKNAIKYYTSKVAYDTATYIATGDKGQKPLFIEEGWGTYFNNVRDESYAIFFNDLSKDMWGKNLCQPLDPLMKVKLDITARKAVGLDPLKGPDCSWDKIKKNIGDIRNMNMGDLVSFNQNFKMSGTDVGAWLTITTGAKEKQRHDLEQAELVRLIEGPYESVINTINDSIKTTSKDVEQAQKNASTWAMEPYLTYTESAVANAIGVFTNTLTAKLLDRVFNKGFNTSRVGQGIDIFLGRGISSVGSAREQFAELVRPDYTLGSSVDVLTELTAECGPGEFASAQFCETIDYGFAQAVEQKLTLAEATDPSGSRLIKTDVPFGYIDKSGSEPDYRSGISYRSILILRKYRIVPVGWEIAAQYFKEFDNINKQISLGYLMDKYDEADSPYYRLVDPYWLLKAPETICMREGAGPDFQVQPVVQCINSEGKNISPLNCAPEEGDQEIISVVRKTYCADSRSCIVENDDGNGCKFFGYCVEEKPIWRISGDQCPAYYNSCLTLEDNDGRSESYLTNTLEVCTEPGCTAYCQDYDPENENWLCNLDETYGLAFYSSDETCSAREEGCQSVDRLLNVDNTPLSRAQADAVSDLDDTGYIEDPINLKFAPDYPGDEFDCSGYNTVLETGEETCSTDGNYWREDIEACVLSGNSLCSNFVYSCMPEDVSCQLYNPTSFKGPSVPAIIDYKECTEGGRFCSDTEVMAWNDECPDICVGFRQYYEKPAQFEDEDPGLDGNQGREVAFVDRSPIQACGQPGCDEFTNLDEVARGGEGLEYYSFLRQCVKPDTAGVQVFYTWEGSDTSGFQLKKWQLLTTGDAPRGDACASDSDCRSFFNPTNDQYYEVDFASVIFASDDCHPFRRTLDQVVYYGIPAYSVECSSSNAGCRSYRDNSSYNYQVVVQDDFDNGVGDWNGGSVSRESVERDGSSMLVSGIADHDISSQDLVAGDRYSVTFVAKGVGGIRFEVAVNAGSSPVLNGEFSGLTDEWVMQTVDLGILPEGTYVDSIFMITGSGTYLDYISLKRIKEKSYIKDSWDNPAICEELADAGMSSCEAYRDGDGDDYSLQSFSSICLEDVVGCEMFVQEDASGVKSRLYGVYDDRKLCNEPGCTRLGKVERDLISPAAWPFYNFDEEFMVIDLSRDVCAENQESCTAYDSGNYKNPGDRVCQFKDGQWWMVGEKGIECPSTDIRQSTQIGFCLGDTTIECANHGQCGAGGICVMDYALPGVPKHCLGGMSTTDRENNTCVDDSECMSYFNFSTPGICTSWSGLCKDSDSGCTEYIDPIDPEECDDGLLPYDTSDRSVLYEANSTPACTYYWYTGASEGDCNGQVNYALGCVPFIETDSDKPLESLSTIENVPYVPITPGPGRDNGRGGTSIER